MSPVFVLRPRRSRIFIDGGARSLSLVILLVSSHCADLHFPEFASAPYTTVACVFAVSFRAADWIGRGRNSCFMGIHSTFQELWTRRNRPESATGFQYMTGNNMSQMPPQEAH